MVFYQSIDMLQGKFMLMNHLHQPYDSIDKMPLYEFDVYIEMKTDDLKENGKQQELG